MKLAFLLIVLLISFSSAVAQSEVETLEWINIKLVEVDLSNCSSVNIRNGSQKRTLEFSSEAVTLKDEDGNSTICNWKDIKEIKIKSSNIQIILDWKWKDDPAFLMLRIPNSDIFGKYFKALKHMATLKGAKMIDDDLF